MNATGTPSSENFNPRAVDAYEVEVCDNYEQEDHMAGPNSRAMTRRPTHPGEMLRQDILTERGCYMLYIYGKDEQGDLSAAQIRELGRLVREEFK